MEVSNVMCHSNVTSFHCFQRMVRHIFYSDLEHSLKVRYYKKQSNPKASRPLTTHSTRSGCSSPVSIVLSRQRAYTPALQLEALNDVVGTLHLPRHLPFASVTHFLHGLLLIYRPRKDERLSCPHWLTHNGQFTHKVVTCLCPTICQVYWHRTRKVCRSKTCIVPLCYAANRYYK